MSQPLSETTDQPTVADVGELGLLKRLQPFCDQALIGDDAAALPWGTGNLVITTDVLVDGVHFSDRTTSPEDVGWRAVAANLSDLAAMGARPVGITVGLSLPSSTAVSWVEAVYRGMDACLQHYGGAIVGGDLCRAAQRALAITAVGEVSPQQVLRRSRAQAGQVIVVTGHHGASRGGLELLLNPPAKAVPGTAALIRAHQRPVPRLGAIAELQALAGVDFNTVAAMDSSDGLANAVLQLCRASGVGARLVRDRLPVPPALVAQFGESTALDWCLYGGEDFELVLCLPPDVALALLLHLPAEAAIIGTVEADPTVLLLERSEDNSGVELRDDGSFQHFE